MHAPPGTGQRPPGPDAIALPLDAPDDVAVALADVRRGVLELGGWTGLLVTLGGLAVVVAIVLLPPAAIPVVLGLVAVGAIDARRRTRAILDRLDLLAKVSDALSDRYDRARLDALRDPLTGLGNHRAFQEALDSAVVAARHDGTTVALLLIDVDDLKRTNETEGHAAGDDALEAIARLITANLRRVDSGFRIGDDEFAVLVPGGTPESGLALGRRLLASALEAHRRPGGGTISFTVGASAVPEPSRDRTQLFRHAEAALYWGKRHGRTDVQVYDPRIQGVADDERPANELAAAVDRIVEERRLVAAYQPVFDLRDGVCRGFEGLIRPADGGGFRHATALFIAAETVTRTVELDIAAVRQIAAGATRLGADRYLAVNLSPRSLEAEAFNPHELLAILGRVGIEPRRIVVELTEREAVEDFERLARNLETFRRTGVRIAADDVGAGNAGLRLLSRVEFDIIKIDLSLVQSGALESPSRSVLRALREMAGQNGAVTVAEGIETVSQLEALRALGIQVGQGYLLGTPRPEPTADRLDLPALIAASVPVEDPRLALLPKADEEYAAAY